MVNEVLERSQHEQISADDVRELVRLADAVDEAYIALAENTDREAALLLVDGIQAQRANLIALVERLLPVTRAQVEAIVEGEAV
jgi:hypothetical protein